MKRTVEGRRRLLKTLLAGGAAVTATTVLPDTWKKPIIDSVIVPVHAQGSVPSFIDTIEFAIAVGGPEGFNSTLTPSNSPETRAFDSNELSEHDYTITPTIIVDPSITDTFTLEVNEVFFGGNSTDFSPSNQLLAPNNTNGVIPFVAINGDVDDASFLTYQITLTSTNPIYPNFFLEITFDEDPPGSALPA
jgi:hypothetical protein